MFIVLLVVLSVALGFVLIGMLLSARNAASETTPDVFSYEMRNPRQRRSGPPSKLAARQQRVASYNRAYKGNVHRGSATASFNISRLFRPLVGQQHGSWVGAALILLALVFFSMMVFRNVLPNAGLILASPWPESQSNTAANSPAKKSANSTTLTEEQLFAGVSGASKALIRLGQLERNQYNTDKEYDTWAWSSCSAASMAEVMNAYAGNKFRVIDVLKVEAGVNAITPELGLLEPTGIDRTVARFGFRATHLTNPSVDKIVKIANDGRPVIISFPPQTWTGGHILVLRGGNSDSVYLADSSRLNLTVMSRARFLELWRGFAVVVTPNK